jgi:hypothetical protein
MVRKLSGLIVRVTHLQRERLRRLTIVFQDQIGLLEAQHLGNFFHIWRTLVNGEIPVIPDGTRRPKIRLALIVFIANPSSLLLQAVSAYGTQRDQSTTTLMLSKSKIRISLPQSRLHFTRYLFKKTGESFDRLFGRCRRTV